MRRRRPVLAAGLGMAAGASIGKNQAAKQQAAQAQTQAAQAQAQAAQAQAQAAPVSPPVQNQTDDVSEKIVKLAELHKAGILTDAEFEAKKTELLKLL